MNVPSDPASSAPPAPAPWPWSALGERLGRDSGIGALMRDLGAALAPGSGTLQLGGGNPSHIPALEERLRAVAARLLEPDAFARCVGDYAPPQGHLPFRAALAALLQARFGWSVTAEHIVLTAGSQASFHAIFNLYGGRDAAGRLRRIVLPMLPEYIGYADLLVEPGALVGVPARVRPIGLNDFRYEPDFDALAAVGPAGAWCLSRPCNPTGGVIDADSLARLRAAAAAAGIPLVLDCAYGLPFPGIVHVEAAPCWDEDLILCLSLSKLGLPGVRTGIVVARPDVAAAIAGFNAVTSLAPGNFGPALVLPLVESGELLDLARDVVAPHYRERAHAARADLAEAFADVPHRVHRMEGGFFAWVHFPGLGVSSDELQRRLAARGVVVVSGRHFHPGLGADRPQSVAECLRLNYACPTEQWREGLRRIAAEVRAIDAVYGRG